RGERANGIARRAYGSTETANGDDRTNDECTGPDEQAVRAVADIALMLCGIVEPATHAPRKIATGHEARDLDPEQPACGRDRDPDRIDVGTGPEVGETQANRRPEGQKDQRDGRGQNDTGNDSRP